MNTEHHEHYEHHEHDEHHEHYEHPDGPLPSLVAAAAALPPAAAALSPAATAGDVIYAVLRRPGDELAQALHPRRMRHLLHNAFRTLDATTYTEIATIDVER